MTTYPETGRLSAPAESPLVIKNVRLYGEGEPTDVVVKDGIIATIGATAEAEDAQVIDGQGNVLLPGLVDMHVHLREPGREDTETIETGSKAAAKGGFTAVFTMANTNPVTDQPIIAESVWAKSQALALCDVHPVGSITKGLEGKTLTEFGMMARSDAKVRMFSDDGKCVQDPQLMRRALEYAKGMDVLLAQHAEDDRMTGGASAHEGETAAKLGLRGWPRVAEESIVARDALLARDYGNRVHICHASTQGTVELLKWAKEQDIPLTAEVTPHHLLLTDETARTYDPVFKVNPPLRTEEDVMALRQAVADGIIDVIGTDHAPHPAETKECEWACAANGMTGLEQALSIIQMTLVDTGMITWRDVARILSEEPAKIGRLDHEQGRPLAEGEPANIVLVDPKATRVIKPEEQATTGKNNPYRGMEVPGSIRATFYAGHPTVLNGELATPRR